MLPIQHTTATKDQQQQQQQNIHYPLPHIYLLYTRTIDDTTSIYLSVYTPPIYTHKHFLLTHEQQQHICN